MLFRSPGGTFLINITDRGPFGYGRRVLAALAATFPAVIFSAEPSTMKGRRFGNVVLAAARGELPDAAVRRAAASAPFPRSVVTRTKPAAPLTDADPMRSPQPPDALWRVGEWDGD